MIDGVLLYKALIVVFDTGDHKMLPLFIFGYGAPLIIATLTIVVVLILYRDQETTNYTNPEICHLGDPYIYYALTMPVALVLLINSYVFVRSAMATRRATEKMNNNNFQRFRIWLRSCLILSFLLSIFWFVIILAGLPWFSDSVKNVLEWLSIGLNGSVGLFSFLYSIMGNTTSKDSQAKKIDSSSSGTRSTGLYRNRTKKFINSKKNSGMLIGNGGENGGGTSSSAGSSAASKRRVSIQRYQ